MAWALGEIMTFKLLVIAKVMLWLVRVTLTGRL